MRPLIWGVCHFCRSSCKIWVLHEIKKQFWVRTIRFFTFSGQKWLPSENTKNPILKRLICIQCQNVIFGLWRPENGNRNYFQVHRIRFFFAYCGLQRPKMTPIQETQKNLFWKDFFSYLLPKCPFWPLEAGKRQKTTIFQSKQRNLGSME